MDNQNVIDEVRLHSDIVDVISSYIPLTQKGKNYFGVCPFHDDQNPSMSVSKDLQIYKCFACGASGNVFNFVMYYGYSTSAEIMQDGEHRGGNTGGRSFWNTGGRFSVGHREPSPLTHPVSLFLYFMTKIS